MSRRKQGRQPQRKKQKVAGISATSSSQQQPPQTTLAECKSPDEVFNWLIWPHDRTTFFQMYWERKHLHIPRGSRKYYGNLFNKVNSKMSLSLSLSLSVLFVGALSLFILYQP